MDEEAVAVAIGLVVFSLLIGVVVYAWMASAGLPTIIAAPMGLTAFFVVLAVFFGITAVIVAAIKAISR